MIQRLRKIMSVFLAVVLIFSSISFAHAEDAVTAGSVPDKLWEQALIGAEDVKFYIPTMATSNLDTEFYSGLGTGHLQGICVDEDMQYMYVSYTDGIPSGALL